MAYHEGERFLYLETPLGEDQLLLQSFKGDEQISGLFDFRLKLLAENATNVDFDKLIGQRVSFGVLGADPRVPARDLNGIVVELSQGARDRVFTEYRMRVVPELWKLKRKFQSRIFQHLTVPDILKQVLAGLDVSYEIQGAFDQREYCTQYQETDFDFFSRLAEEEGIYYFFKFTHGSHKLVLANTPPSHPDIPGDSTLIFETVEGGGRDEERIDTWKKEQYWGSGKYTVWDHHFELPHKKLDAQETVIGSVQVGKVSHKLKLSGNDDLEIYENPGCYAQRYDGIDKAGGEKPSDLQKISTDNKRTVGIRMQQEETPMLRISAGGNCRQITPGHKFTLRRHFNADGQYVVLKVWHEAQEADFRSDQSPRAEDGEEEETHYSNSFTCLPYELPFRPSMDTDCPVIAGPQTAVVVGPSGEEISTDKYGRVKVQFHWDREGKNDLNSSCWLRVATQWAGKQWGAIHLPRIGQEVVVAFIEGDPDRPIIVGSVYNADMMPPYKLPDHKTVSTLKSRSSKQGSASNFNELRYEDLKGSEQLFLHAERDKDERVKGESREFVGGNRHLMVTASRKAAIGGSDNLTVGGDFSESVGKNFNTTVQSNSRELVNGNKSVTVQGNTEEITSGNFGHAVGGEIHLMAGTNVVIEAGMALTIKAGGNFITIGPAGIAIQGTMVLINSGGAPVPGSEVITDAPTDPAAPDTADDGTKFGKL